MSTTLRVLLVICVFLILFSSTLSGQIVVNFDFGAVRIMCGNDYAYAGVANDCSVYGYNTQNFNQSSGFGWILGGPAARHLAPTSLEGGAGLTGPNTIFYPPPFDGMPFNQAVFLQDVGSFAWQQVQGFSPGTYTLSFYLGSRYINGPYDGNQTVVALIDRSVIGTWALSSYTPFTLQTARFTVTTAGSHTIEFVGLNRGDHTAFLSYVVISRE